MDFENKKGTSLIELLIYIAIMVFMMASILSFISYSKKNSSKNEAINEVEFQGGEMVEMISQQIRNAKEINIPLAQTNNSQLAITVDSAIESPTIIDLLNGKMRIKRGAIAANELNSNKIIVSNLIFNNFSNPSTKGSVSFQFDVKYSNASNRTELDYAKTFFGSASLR